MPLRAARLCRCGHRVASGVRCPCERQADAARKARFDATRPSSSARGYTSAWEKARAGFLAQHRFCRRCGAPASVVDHIRPHKGDQALFWDKGNWQALCTPCHSGAKQREERRTEDAGMFDVTAFAAAGARLYVGEPTAEPADLDRHQWTPLARLEALGNAAGGIEIIARLDDLDIGQGMLRASAITKAPRAFRVVFPDGGERLFVARVTSARDRTRRLRVVLSVIGKVSRASTPMLAVAS